MPLEDLTHDELDEVAAAHDVADYPSSANKPDKVAALQEAGVPEDATPQPAPEPRGVQRARTEQAGLDPVLAKAREEARAAEEAAAKVPTAEDDDEDAPAPGLRPAGRTADEQTAVVDPQGRLAYERDRARKVEAGEADVRDGLVTFDED